MLLLNAKDSGEPGPIALLEDDPPSFEEAVAGPSSQLSLGNSSPSPGLNTSRGALNKGAGEDQRELRSYLPGESPNPETSAPPPGFAPYDAEFETQNGGDIVSHDPHLNDDGEALYRFILGQLKPPTLKLHCHGEHTEYRTRQVSTVKNGKTEWRTESYNEIVTDFDFYIDLTDHLYSSPPVLWTRDDRDFAYRGKMVLEAVGAPTDEDAGDDHHLAERDALMDDEEQGLPHHAAAARTRIAKRQDRKRTEAWWKYLLDSGLPPWISQADYEQGRVDREALRQHEYTPPLRSKMTLRAWADDYCASDKILKDFTFEKVIYGWNIASLLDSVRILITSTSYQGRPTASLVMEGTKVHVRPDTPLSRILSNKWLVVLLWITLIYPFIWIFRRYNKRGGGRWEVCGAAYALKRRATEGAREGDIVGVKEGEWMRLWENSIRWSVVHNVRTVTPLTRPERDGFNLDGYFH